MMHYKHAIEFVGKGVALSHNPSLLPEVLHEIQSGKLSWEMIVWAGSSQMMLPALYVQLKKNNLLSELPADLVEYLEELYRHNLLRNQAILDQIKDIIQCLNKHHIYPVFLKGTANLLDGLYSDPAERMIGDIDFIIPEDQIIACADILVKELGYERDIEPGAGDLKYYLHYPRLRHKSTVAAIEIHRQPIYPPFDEVFNFKVIDREKKEVNQFGKAYVLSDRHQVILNILNTQVNDSASFWGLILMRQSYDLLLLTQRLDPMKAALEFNRYFGLMNLHLAGSAYIFNYPPALPFKNTCRAKLHLWRLGVLLTYPKINKFQNKLLGFPDSHFVRYSRWVIRSFYDGNALRYIIRRLFNPGWYRDHLASYRRAGKTKSSDKQII